MYKRKILIFVSVILIAGVFAWISGNALSQENVTQDTVVKEKATRDDAAGYLGKLTPSEQKAAAIRARQLGLLPGNAGRNIQTPVSTPTTQTPAQSGAPSGMKGD